MLAQTRGGAISYYLDDGQGNVRLLTDGNGAVTDRYSYDAYGNLLSSQGTTINPYRYTGQQFDSLTGLYDLRARYYDPTSGRFLSRDTASIDVSNPVEVNRYNYAEENPVNLRDPSGHDAFAEYQETNQIVKPWEKLIPVIGVAVSAYLLLLLLRAGLLQRLIDLLTRLGVRAKAAANEKPQPNDVIVDTNAVYMYASVQANIFPDERAVITETTVYELAKNALKGLAIPAIVASLPVVQDVYDPVIARNLRAKLDVIQPVDQGRPGDVIIGTTALATHRPLITFDKHFGKAVAALGGEVRPDPWA